MNIRTNNKKESRKTHFEFLNSLFLKSLMMSALLWAVLHASLQAQDVTYTRPSWRFGIAGAANVNFYRGSTQQLNADFTAPVAFNHGNGLGLFLAPVLEYHAPNSPLGFMLQVGYDGRQSKFNKEITLCNCPADLSTNLSYITVEPSLRLAPFNSDFYLFGGPRVAFNFENSFTYKLGKNPDFPEQLATPDVNGELSNTRKTLLSMQIGAGYDIQLSSQNHQTQAILSPFISFQPYFGQSPRSIETWNISTLRVGAALKFGHGSLVTEPANAMVPVIADPDVRFYVNSPKNAAVERRVSETFPLRNYVFFDLGSTDIPDRYVLLNRNQVKDFKEDQLEVFAPKKLSGRSSRQMTVYYNVLNIIGDRLGKNPASSITLVGSSEKGSEDGKMMAESIKQYLGNVFGIDGSRISVEGRNKPVLPSEQPNSGSDLTLLREGDRRVSIESNSPALLMEFQSGPNAQLRPVEIAVSQEAPMDSYVSFNAEGAQKAFSSWSLEIRDDKNKLQTFGPYTRDQVNIPGKTIMGTRPQGDYKVTMVGQTKSGMTVRKDANVDMVLWTPGKNEEGMRFSVIYEFDESKAISIYEKYLTEIVIPKIPMGGTVMIHGHTDITGDEVYNQKLSLARANDVRGILAAGLAKAGRSDVKFEVQGSGEDQVLSPFENNYPEERFYNRTVIIDIIPRK
ncbi:MAG: OmpA family protein [Saprospiraceae bacterium]|nr:OmpA family protein [Saprospiraceae bacterium]